MAAGWGEQLVAAAFAGAGVPRPGPSLGLQAPPRRARGALFPQRTSLLASPEGLCDRRSAFGLACMPLLRSCRLLGVFVVAPCGGAVMPAVQPAGDGGGDDFGSARGLRLGRMRGWRVMQQVEKCLRAAENSRG